MKSRKEHELRYKLGEETHRIIKKDIMPQSGHGSYVADFTRQAISNQSPQLAQSAGGGMIAKRLILLLSDIRGIDEKIPDSNVRASIKDEDFSKSLTVSISNEVAKKFGKLTDETMLSTSAAVRYCMFGELYEYDQSCDALENWMSEEIARTWSGIRTTIAKPVHHLYYVLGKRFTHQREITLHFIQKDPLPFQHFAEAYKSDFYRSNCYTGIVSKHGDHVLNSVENTIEEYTEISFDPERREFLPEYETR
jgi:hypothetical protein